ncbi:hypothetical protein FGO68_gene10982 [Halteria grandinella]|uniref:Uncharacterized protein n=1 Tax=Halteria grandinella TaxID=5974 RepID=A0A8J8SWH8_HALGN|nr:hypothetical protein FGO68_gene10982 [Halteria grandinella]
MTGGDFFRTGLSEITELFQSQSCTKSEPPLSRLGPLIVRRHLRLKREGELTTGYASIRYIEFCNWIMSVMVGIRPTDDALTLVFSIILTEGHQHLYTLNYKVCN